MREILRLLQYIFRDAETGFRSDGRGLAVVRFRSSCLPVRQGIEGDPFRRTDKSIT
jgi:hypothetical protein